MDLRQLVLISTFTCWISANGSTDSFMDLKAGILSDSDVFDYPDVGFANADYAYNRQNTCKVQPTDKSWPSKARWDVLDFFVGGRLVKPVPIAAPCYQGEMYDSQECAHIDASWYDSDFHEAHPSSIMSPLFTGLSCLPTSESTVGNCSQGTYPEYVVNARTVRDVQATVNFARNTNVRLVIKNTGHDFAGKASGKGSLSIRTHLFKGIKFIAEYVSKRYTGPAFKVGSGVQARDIYAAAHKKGYIVVGGEGQTVGYAGGYIQGGGHSPMSSKLGMGADSALSMDIVLANGSFVTANPDINADLFWALCGGGGSTFGVVISMTVKVHEDLPVTISQFSFNASDRDIRAAQNGDIERKDFWDVVKTYFSLFIDHADRGIYSYWNVAATTDGGLTFRMAPYFAPEHTATQVTQLLKPIVDKAKELSIGIDPVTTSFDNFYDAWVHGFPKEVIGNWNSQLGSRLFPRSNFQNDSPLFAATWEAIKAQTNRNLTHTIGFNIAPTLKAGGYPDNSVNPAWRNTVAHVITSLVWDVSIRDLDYINAVRRDFTHNQMGKWRALSPGAGSYMNEADINEPNPQQAFWGTMYNRLYQIKQRYDPAGVFFAETAVGSEGWTTGPDRLGALCPA